MTRAVAIALVLALPSACSDSTGPSILSYQSILAHRAQWRAQGLTDYSYTYHFWAFHPLAGHPLRLEIRGDTVRSVINLDTGDSISAAYFPTIEGLFDRALEAAKGGFLRSVDFDPVRSFPTHVGYVAVPDALSSQDASDLQPHQ